MADLFHDIRNDAMMPQPSKDAMCVDIKDFIYRVILNPNTKVEGGCSSSGDNSIWKGARPFMLHLLHLLHLLHGPLWPLWRRQCCPIIDH